MSNYKISDKQKLNIIAERQNGKSIKELSKLYKVSRQTISMILNDAQTLQNLTQTLQEEKEEVILKWSAYWNSQSKIGQEISTKAFELLKAKIEKAIHGAFERFLYYKVKLSIKNIVYTAYLNIGVDKQNISTLYDINQFNEKK